MPGGVFLDTGFFIAWVNPRDKNHARAQELLRAIKEGRWSHAETNDHVLAEALNWLRARVSDPAAAQAVLRLVFGGEDHDGLVGAIHHTDQTAYTRALADHFRYADQGLSFTDCTVLASMETLGLRTLATFDAGFRGLVEVAPTPPEHP